MMLQSPTRLAVLAGLLAFGATGVALALMGLGVPFLVAAAGPAAMMAFVLYAGLSQAGLRGGNGLRGGTSREPAQVSAEAEVERAGVEQTEAAQAAAAALRGEISAHRQAMATLRHDLRGILSPALMMSDRLIAHADPAVQRAGQAVVRSIERATAVLSAHKDAVGGEGPTPPAP